MKKILLFLIILIIPINVTATSYIVMDASSNRVLEGTNINEKHLIASITKIMTSVIALENSDINQEVEVSSDVLKAYGSAIYIEVGEKLTLEDLLYGLMLRSGNDAAIEIAKVVSNSMDEFVKKMNEKAQELGMNNTIFINNHGLEDKDGNGNLSTSYDMAILMSYALKNDKFREIISTKRKVVKSSNKTYDWYNKNKLLMDYKYCIGGKTGFTKKARRTLVTAANKDNKEIIVVTLNDPNDFLNHKALYEENFKKYNLVTILNKNAFKLENVNYNGRIYIKDDFKMLLTKEEENNISIDYEMIPNGRYNDEEKVGIAHIKLNDEEIGTKNIYLDVNNKKEITNKNNWFQRLIDFIIFWR